MSILIEELHLPTERLYPLHLTIYSDGNVFCGHGIGKRAYKATEVPAPHGRLGDLDRLEEELAFDYAYAAADICKAAPTIIPADKEAHA